MCLENASLGQNLEELSNVGLAFVFESFENDLLQVEHFYSPKHFSRDKIRLDQIIKDGKFVSLRY